MDDEEVALQFAADVEEAVASVRELAAAAQELAAAAKEAQGGVAGLTGPAAAAGDAVKEVADASASAETALTGNADAAKGVADSYAGLSAAAKGAADAQKGAAAASDAAGAASEGAAAKTDASAGLMEGAAGKAKLALLGVGAGLAYGVYKAAGFQQQMELLHTQAGTTTQTMNQMSAGVLQLAGKVGQGPDSLAEAAYHVASNMSSMGATSAQMLSAVKVAAEGASVGNANLVDVTNALGAAIASGMKGTQDYTQAMGAMNATVGAGDMKMQDLAEAFGEGNLATVKGYGATLTDVGSILATFGDNNLRGAAAGTEMRMAVQALAVQAATAKPALKELGLSAGQIGAYMRQHGVVDTLNLLNDRMKAAGITAQNEGPVITDLFGKKAGSGISVLLEQIDRVNSKVPELVKGAHDFSGAWAAQQATPAQKLKDLQAGSEALAISLGTALLPVATKVIGALSDLVNWLEKGSAGAKGAAAVIGGVLALMALKKLEDGLKGAVEGAEGLVKGFKAAVGGAQALIVKLTGAKAATEAQTTATEASKAVQEAAAAESEAQAVATEALTVAKEESIGATEAATVAQDGLNLAMLANPITLIIIAIIALVAGFVYLWTHSAAFRDFWIGAWKDIRAAALEAWHFLDNDVIHPIMAGIDAVVSFVRDHWQLLATILATILLGPVAGLVVFLATHWQQVTSDVSKLVSDVVGFFERLPGEILHFLESLPGDMLTIGHNIVMGLLNGIESMGSVLANGIESLIPSPIRSIVSTALGIFSPSTVFHGYGVNLVMGMVNGIRETVPALHATVAGMAGGVSGIGSSLAASAVAPAGGSTSVHVSVPMTVQGSAGAAYSDPRFRQYLQGEVQEAVLRYDQLNPTNGLSSAWGR